MRMTKILTLTNDTIDQMLSDPAFAEFSFVQATPTLRGDAKPAGCGGCKRKKRQAKLAQAPKTAPAKLVDYNTVRKQIYFYDEQQISALKEKLGCTSIKLTYRNKKTGLERKVV